MMTSGVVMFGWSDYKNKVHGFKVGRWFIRRLNAADKQIVLARYAARR